MVGLARRPDDGRPARAGELHREQPDAAGRRVDEQHVAVGDVEQLQHAIGGARADRKAAGGRPVHLRGLGRQGGRVGQRELGVGRRRGEPEHLVADAQRLHALADLVDDAGQLGAEARRQLERVDLGHHAAPHLGLDRVDAGGSHGEADLPGPGLRIGDVDELEDLRAPVPRELDRLRHVSRSARRGWL